MTESSEAANQQKTEPIPPTSGHEAPDTGGPGESHEVPALSEVAAEGTSEELPPVEGIRVDAEPGHADGEPDTRAPSTGTF
ncbi:MAG: hypothetical protein QOE45_470 [Frankiaceae bacterium]|jgi:hypothetical protein|nr:hypothetical protein [Frankiaceae bacterium]